ncbi:4-(cytidine 5'-diphospho)-2-C-methyl-D-erythritol kinase [Sphingomonas sp. RB56-2]|uniref:4-diphosphocytidyl-2-C-methyl-D-erythritol kinase n=1 Tax=Sphingomonas brevis TaxID=2908206 RepID=A0ABT0S806_9SPHN|nr:4-(cytidine 5'-diphospho)-2-C-methyl-D-erythritol kinase [Sphingomonas brevis]MCL6740249.1 4-(cytidine 5'-diphospho)-2-C-methyl-D-erythritol kinase [Sphingomonas brevis]
MRLSEPAPAKLNLALHVRGTLPDGRHALETIFAFCTDGDRLDGEDSDKLSLDIVGPFADSLAADDQNLVLRAAHALADAANIEPKAALTLTKNLPIASGMGGGSADAAAALRLLTRLWNLNPSFAVDVAPKIGSDVPACLLSLSARGTESGDKLELVQDLAISGQAVLLVNPRVALSTRDVFATWDGIDRGPLGDWRRGRNDLALPARSLVPAIGDVLDWLKNRTGANLVRMSGSGATCFALFGNEAARDAAAAACPVEWWHLATDLR